MREIYRGLLWTKHGNGTVPAWLGVYARKLRRRIQPPQWDKRVLNSWPVVPSRIHEFVRRVALHEIHAIVSGEYIGTWSSIDGTPWEINSIPDETAYTAAYAAWLAEQQHG